MAGGRFVDPIMFTLKTKKLRPAFKMMKFLTKPRFLDSLGKMERSSNARLANLHDGNPILEKWAH